MTTVQRLRAKTIYHCDICGTDGEWSGSWARYTSILHDEVCPDEMPTVCSDKCAKVLDEKMASGQIQLPKLSKGSMNSHVTRKRKGY